MGGIETWKERPSVGVEDAVLRVGDFKSIYVLHPFQFAVQNILVNIRILEGADQGEVHVVQGLRDKLMLFGMILDVAHALFYDFPEGFQIDIHVLLHGSYQLNHDLLDKFPLNFVDLGLRIGLTKFADSALAHLDFLRDLARCRGNTSLALPESGNFPEEALLFALERSRETLSLLFHILRLLFHHGFQSIDLTE